MTQIRKPLRGGAVCIFNENAIMKNTHGHSYFLDTDMRNYWYSQGYGALSNALNVSYYRKKD